MREYTLAVDSGTNPGGASWRLNGEDKPITIGVNPGGSADVVVEFFRGPVANNYENVALILNAACDPKGAADTVTVNFSFRETCSNIAIYEPQNGFVVKMGDSPLVPITLFNYRKNDPRIREVQVQYRRAVRTAAKAKNPTDGYVNATDWITIRTIQGNELNEDFFILNWDTSPLGDDSYEIRAILACSGETILSASQLIKGIIDRNPPRVLGRPEPRSGVYGPADQIFVQFNEPIDPNGINPLTDILLINTETGNPIDREVTVFSNAIAIVPKSEDRFLENRVLRVVINRIRDMRGNQIENPIVWEFLFDKSPVRWANARVDLVSYLDQSVSFIRTFQNSGGTPVSFDLTNLPSWITAFPMSGTLAPGTSVDIRFNVSAQLGAGQYNTVIRANTALGAEPINISVRLLCGGPGWTIDATRFSQSMNVVGELYIQDELSTDTYDQVGFFIGNELRGVANVEFVPGLNKHQIYATVYANTASEGPVTVRAWDASACLEFGSIIETYNFTANTLLGTPQNPVKLSATRNIVQPLRLNRGWTWFSLNTISPNMAVGGLFKDLTAQSGDVVRGQSAFSVFSTQAGWVGTLDTLRTGSMYQTNLKTASDIVLTGRPLNLVRDSIPLTSGWNWLGYQPTFSLNTNDALRNLVALNGDIIKSQTQFAVYVAGTGWVGNLAALAPLRGYLLFTRNGGRFTYPSVPQQELPAKAKPEDDESGHDLMAASPWKLNPYEFQYSMNMIATLGGSIKADTGLVVGVFSEDQIRGIGKTVRIPGFDKPVVFLTAYAHRESGENLTFRLFDPKSEVQMEMTDRTTFVQNTLLGSVEEPFNLHVLATSNEAGLDLPKKFELMQNYPNPFNGSTVIQYALPVRSNVTITVYNILGQPVAKLVDGNIQAGYHRVSLNSASLASGMYVYELKADGFRAVKKLVHLK
jgi:hypothetical protein